MGDLDDKWLAIFDALLVEILKVTGLTTANTFQGLDQTPIGDPLVLIGPGDIVPVANDTGGSYYRMDWLVVIIVEKSDLKAGLISTFDWAGLIRQEILDDRTLGGVVENTEDIRYKPNGLATLPGFERQHLVMTITTFGWIDDP